MALVFFFVFIALTLGITYWAARRTRTTDHFYAAGRSVSAGQNGLALAGDYMSAASFLGIAGLVSTTGFDGLIYSTGWLVGWPVVLFLIAEPLRNLGRYTFADVVALRFRPVPVRMAAALGTLATVTFYLIAQMVGAGSLIRLLFGLPFEAAVAITGAVMIVYVLFGGMLATTWVQIVKAGLLLGGASVLGLLVLARFDFDPTALFAAAAERYGDAVLAPGRLVSSPLEAISLGMALMFGTAGLPHILMRFYTVPAARAARTSVFYATGLIGYFYLMTFVLGFGAMVLVGPEAIRAADPGGNMAAPLLAELLGGTPFLGFISAVAFATILAVVAGLTLSGAAALSHDLWVNVVRGGRPESDEELRVARIATVALGVLAITLGISFKGQNVAFMVGRGVREKLLKVERKRGVVDSLEKIEGEDDLVGALARELRPHEGDAVLVLEGELRAIESALRERLHQGLPVLAESEEGGAGPTGEVQEHERRERRSGRERGAADHDHEGGGETDGDRSHDHFDSDLSGEPLAPRKRLVEHLERRIVHGVLERLVESLVSDGEPEDAGGNGNRGDGENGEGAEEVGGGENQEAHQDSESIEKAPRHEDADGEVHDLSDAGKNAEEAGEGLDLVPAGLHLGEKCEIDEVFSEDREERQDEDRLEVGARPERAHHPALAASCGFGLLASAASHLGEPLQDEDQEREAGPEA